MVIELVITAEILVSGLLVLAGIQGGRYWQTPGTCVAWAAVDAGCVALLMWSGIESWQWFALACLYVAGACGGVVRAVKGGYVTEWARDERVTAAFLTGVLICAQLALVWT